MIDLKATYGDRFKVTYEESASIPNQTAADRAWLQVVEGHRAHIYIHGENNLGVYVRTFNDGSDRLGRLLAIPGARLHQNGDREATVVIPNDQFERAAEIIRARRRRQLSDSERRRLAEIGAEYRFQHGYGVERLGQIRDDADPNAQSAENVPGAILEAFP
jgi:hypothetical protein